MEKVSFILKRVVMFAFLFTLINALPLPNHGVIAKASKVEKEKVSDARLTYTTMRLVLEDTLTLSIRNLDREAGETVVFKVSDKSIALIEKVNSTKVDIKAEGVGETTITATVRDGKRKTIKTLTCNVTVGPTAQSIKFTESEVVISLSDEAVATTLKAIVKPGNTEEKPKITTNKNGVVLVSNEANVNTGIATINVKALEEGKVTITITLANGVTDTCTIQVVE